MICGEMVSQSERLLLTTAIKSDSLKRKRKFAARGLGLDHRSGHTRGRAELVFFLSAAKIRKGAEITKRLWLTTRCVLTLLLTSSEKARITHCQQM